MPLLKNKGFTVQFHTRPGAHDFTTFGNALADALPWAAGRFFTPDPGRGSDQPGGASSIRATVAAARPPDTRAPWIEGVSRWSPASTMCSPAS